jgi:hypothetical protein
MRAGRRVITAQGRISSGNAMVLSTQLSVPTLPPRPMLSSSAFARALQKSPEMILFGKGFAGGTDGGASGRTIELYRRAGE